MLVSIWAYGAYQAGRFFDFLRSFYWKSLLRKRHGDIGRNLLVKKGVSFSLAPDSSILIGSNVTIAEGARIFVGKSGRLVLNDHVFVGADTTLIANASLIIGEGTQIAHRVTIIDTDHQHKIFDQPLRNQGSISREIRVGEECWIGAHAILLKGVTLGNRVVVGAGSVVTKTFADLAVVGGCPAKLIQRND